MAIHLARSLLRRYPALRSTWPVQQASAWRERQGRRARPRRMASWYRDATDMRTRLFMSNLELPEAPHLCEPTTVLLTLMDEDGARVAQRRFALQRNGSLALELGDLLPATRRGHVQSGQVTIDFEGPQLGSSRAYLHWYNARSLTSSHEKFGLTIPAVGGYWTVPNVQDSERYRVHLALVNLDDQAYTSTVVLKDGQGQELSASLELPPQGSRFVSLTDLFPAASEHLAGRPGVLHFGNNRQPAMYYYFVHNPQLGTWRAQHL
jgi:hypothetical protein